MNTLPKILSLPVLLAMISMIGLGADRAVAYEIQGSPIQTGSPINLNSGGVNDLLKNTQPQVNNLLKGLSGGSSTPSGVSIDSFFNFKNLSSNDAAGIAKAVFGLFIKILATIVSVTIDALKGILGSVQK